MPPTEEQYGLHDWGSLTTELVRESSARARELFDCGVASLTFTLPYYDANGFSAYDLSHLIEGVEPNIQAEYHAIHIHLLHALESIEHVDVIQEYLERWKADVGG